jgi:o-succinylbenzoate synthase
MRGAAGLAGAELGEVCVQALVQGTAPADVEASARAAMDEGFGTFKLKLAVDPARRDVGMDVERVAALREAVGSAARIRLDANEAWARSEAEQALSRLAEFRIDYVEQPVAREALADLAALGALGEVGIAADEALLGGGLARCLEVRAASILIVKPSALGGVSAALSLVERAREEGLRIVWSNLFEGIVGRSLAVALAAATSDDGEVHGLGTAGLLARDLDDPAGSEILKEERGGVVSSERLFARARAISPAWSRPPSQIWDSDVWEARG